MNMYTTRELYIMALIAQRHTPSFLNRDAFWSRMVTLLPDYLRDREGTALQVDNIPDYCKSLESMLDPELVHRIRAKVDACTERIILSQQ